MSVLLMDMEKEQLIKFLEKIHKILDTIETNNALDESKKQNLLGYLEGGLEGVKNSK